MKIEPDTENEIRIVPLVNLQGPYAGESHDITINELRSVMRALWPEIPERFELLHDAHCKVIDHDDCVRTYYINEEMWNKLTTIYSFLDDLPEDLFPMSFKPYDLMAVLGQLGVALEPKTSRARRIKSIRETEEWLRKVNVAAD